MKISVVTPEKKVLDMECVSCVLPLYDGEIGIENNRSPLIGRVGFGELRIKTESGTERYYVDGGFVEVLDNNISIMTGNAIPTTELNADEASKQLEEALAVIATTDDVFATKERKVKQARAKLRLAPRK